MVGLADRDVGQKGHHVSDIQIKDASLELRVISHQLSQCFQSPQLLSRLYSIWLLLTFQSHFIHLLRFKRHASCKPNSFQFSP